MAMTTKSVSSLAIFFILCLVIFGKLLTLYFSFCKKKKTCSLDSWCPLGDHMQYFVILYQYVTYIFLSIFIWNEQKCPRQKRRTENVLKNTEATWVSASARLGYIRRSVIGDAVRTRERKVENAVQRPALVWNAYAISAATRLKSNSKRSLHTSAEDADALCLNLVCIMVCVIIKANGPSSNLINKWNK